MGPRYPDKNEQSEILKRMMASERTQRDLPDYEPANNLLPPNDTQIIKDVNYASKIIRKSIRKK